MANHKSALKRANQSEIRRMRNKTTKSRIKNVVKEVRLAVDENGVETASSKLTAAKAIIDKAVKTGVIHKNTGSRKVSRLAKLVNAVKA